MASQLADAKKSKNGLKRHTNVSFWCPLVQIWLSSGFLLNAINPRFFVKSMFKNFYSDTDCRFIQFDGANVTWDECIQTKWNKNNPHRSPFQRDLDRLVFSGPF